MQRLKRFIKGLFLLVATTVLTGVVVGVGTILYWEFTFWQASRAHPPKSTPVQHDPDSSAEKLLSDCDFLHCEMRQDLAAGLSQAESLVQNLPRGPERATALLARGRIERLRGEYLKAEKSLEEALAEEPEDYLMQHRVLAEREVLLSDRYGTPWGEGMRTDADFGCQAPKRLMEIRTLGSALDVIKLDMRAAWGTEDAEADWREQQIHQDDLLYFLGSRQDAAWGHTLNAPDQLHAIVTEMLKSTLDTDISYLSMSQVKQIVPENRLNEIKARIAVPYRSILSIPSPSQAPAEVSDQSFLSSTTRSSMEQLSDLEVKLFPGSSPYLLGFYVRRPSQDEDTLSPQARTPTNDYFRTSPPTEAPELNEAVKAVRTGLEASGARRSLAWLSLMEGAWCLSLRLERNGSSDACTALEMASQFSLATGDRRTWRTTQVLEAVEAVLDGDTNRADELVKGVVTSARDGGAYGELVGFARLFSTLAFHFFAVEYSPEQAERCASLAARLYDASGARIEQANHALRWAALLKRAGRYTASVAALHDAAKTLEPYRQVLAGSPAALAGPGCTSKHSLPTGAWCALVDCQRELLFSVQDTREAFADEISNTQSLGADLGAPAFSRIRPTELGATMSMRTAWGAILDGMAVLKETLAKRWGTRARRITDSEGRLPMDGMKQGMSEIFRVASGLVMQCYARISGFQLAIDRGIAEVRVNPDLSLERRFQEAEHRYAQGDTDPFEGCVPIILQKSRGDLARARAIWDRDFAGQLSCTQLSVPFADNSDETDSSSGELAETGALTDTRIMASLLNSIQHPSESLRVLREYERRAGSPTWYDSLQDPWQYMALYVDAYSGLGQHDKSLPLAHDMVSRLEKRRENMFDEVFRRAWLDRTDSSDVFGSAVMAATLAGDADDALEFMERAKARSLQDRLGSPTDPRLASLRRLADEVALRESVLNPARCTKAPAPCAQERVELDRALEAYRDARDRMGVSAVPGVEGDFLQLSSRLLGQLPPDAALVSFYQGKQRLAIVGLAPGQTPLVRTIELPPPGELEGRTDRLSASLNSRVEDSAFDRDKAILSKLLVGPLEPLLSLPTIRRLYLVPHAELQRVPFALLNFEGRPLVERFVLRELPYASLLLAAQGPGYQKAVSLSMDDNDVMGYGGDQKTLNLRPELTAVSGVYGVQWDIPPTRSRVLEALTRDGMLHLAAHGASGTRNEMLSMLDLPRDKNGDEDLSPLDILLHPAPLRKRCVVLSACSLGMEHKTAGDDGTGIPRALLKKGVGEVVMGLWIVSATEEANSLLVDFHQRWRVTQDAAESLAEAQRAAIARGIRPGIWATFVVMGR